MSRRSGLLGPSLCALALLVGAAGCATKSDVQDLERSMVAQIQELEEQQLALMDRIGLAFDSLSEQERRQLSGRGQMQRQFDDLRDLLAQILDLASQNNQLLNDLRASRTGRAEPSGALPGGARPAPGGATPSDPGAGGAADEASTFYRAALAQYNRGSYGTARGGFEDFLQNYPDHELAPDAQYFLAETFAAEEEFGRALEELAKVWQGWPDHPRAATALYRSGVIEVERGRLDDARVFFQRVLAGYPNSAEAPLAENQLSRLGG